MKLKELKENNSIITDLIDKNWFNNPYLYIDSKVYGFCGENVKTFIDEKNKIILYHYYNDLQILSFDNLTEEEIECVTHHIIKYDFNMITGISDIINLIYNKLKNKYKKTSGYIMKKNFDNKLSLSGKTEVAKDSDLYNISKLICSDENIGSNYEVDGLYKQLLERKNEKNCQNIIIRNKKDIIAHAATYADMDKFSIIGGVITNPLYRNRGLGKIIVKDISCLIQSEKKIPILYCYSKDLMNWYSSMNFKVINKCTKLQKIK